MPRVPGALSLIEPGEPLPTPHASLLEGQQPRDLGFMLHDLEFDQDPRTKKVRHATPHFFRAQMHGGAIDVPPLPFHRA